jgi:hypothetical protein
MAGGAYVWRSHSAGAQTAKHTHTSSEVDAHELTALSALSSTAKSPRKHSHVLSAALELIGPEYVELNNRWFDPPTFVPSSTSAAGAQQFASTTTPLVIDPSCATRAEMRAPNLEASIRNAVGVDTTQAVPLDALVQQVSQFWQRDGWFYQLSARWDKDIPATYTLEHYRSQGADFSAVERISVNQAGPMDAISMATRIDEGLANAEKQGAKRGARLVQLLLGGEEGDSLQDLKIHNGRPVAWMFGYGHCRLRNDGAAFCRCVDPASASEAQKQEHRVID